MDPSQLADYPAVAVGIATAAATLLTAVLPRLIKRVLPTTDAVLQDQAVWRGELQGRIRELEDSLVKERAQTTKERADGDAWERRYNRVYRDYLRLAAHLDLDPEKTLPESLPSLLTPELSAERVVSPPSVEPPDETE